MESENCEKHTLWKVRTVAWKSGKHYTLLNQSSCLGAIGRGAGTGGQLPPLPFYQEGQGGQYCPLHFSTIVTKQTLANLKARLSKAG